MHRSPANRTHIEGLDLNLSVDEIAVGDDETRQHGWVRGAAGLSVVVDWSVSGAALGLIGGAWKVRVNLESEDGVLEEPIAAETAQVLATVEPNVRHRLTIGVPPGWLPDGPHPTRRARLAVDVSHSNRGVVTGLTASRSSDWFEIR